MHSLSRCHQGVLEEPLILVHVDFVIRMHSVLSSCCCSCCKEFNTMFWYSGAYTDLKKLLQSSASRVSSSSSSWVSSEEIGLQRRMRCFLLVVLAATVVTSIASAATIGIDYGRQADDLPSPTEVVQLLQSLQVNKVRIYDTNADVLRAFANTSIDVIVTIHNSDIPSLASDANAAATWVADNVQLFVPSTNISLIAVGNEILTVATGYQSQLVQAMQNLYNALVSAGLNDRIRVSTPHAFDVVQTSYPPSAGAFQSSFAESVMRPLLEFLSSTASVFMVNIFPFFSYTRNSDSISLDYALLNPNAPTVQDADETYTNLFHAQVDAVISAMRALGYNDIPVMVSESGWPSAGDSSQMGPSITNAQTYNNNLVKLVLANPPIGTPLRPGVSIDTYIFALFNENQKTGAATEKNWGLFYPDKTHVYPCELTV